MEVVLICLGVIVVLWAMLFGPQAKAERDRESGDSVAVDNAAVDSSDCSDAGGGDGGGAN